MIIALAGNPNCGKTTLFNALTGSSQYVGNWPGVTVEKKEGKLKGNKSVSIMDLPGIYSLSPYTLEEVVTRDYLIDEKPDVILNIVDASNLERNLYLTTQLLETGIPVVVALNMMDMVEKNGDKIDVAKLSQRLGCPVYTICALKESGIKEATDAAIKAAGKKANVPNHFTGEAATALAAIEEVLAGVVNTETARWYAVKLFERDEKIQAKLNLSTEQNAKDDPTLLAMMPQYFTMASAYAFMVFNLLCAPCFAAIGAIRREMNSAKWTLATIAYQCTFAWIVAFLIYQIGTMMGF